MIHGSGNAAVPCVCGEPAQGTSSSYHPMLHPQARELLAELKVDDFLFHLLDCPGCRDVAIADLGGRKASAPAPRTPPLINPETRPEAEALFAELVKLASEQLEVFQDARFHDPVLLNLILEKGEEAGRKRNFQGAADLAWLAVDLASCITSEDFWVHARLARAFFLAGSARRLEGDLKQAEAAFDSASLYLPGSTLERGLYCRSVALLRWDEQSLDEAAGLLRRGAEAFGESRRREEEGTCLALLGLLHLEEGEFAKALGPLLRGHRALESEARPWLTVRCSLALALCFAALTRNEDARRALEEARGTYEGCPYKDDSEVTVIQWLEGKVASWLGEFGEANKHLDSARQRFLAQHRMVEAGLASLDLAALYTQAQRPGEVKRLSADLRRRGQGQGAGALAVELLQRFATGDLIAPPRACAVLYGAQLLKMARLRRLGAPPIPWV